MQGRSDLGATNKVGALPYPYPSLPFSSLSKDIRGQQPLPLSRGKSHCPIPGQQLLPQYRPRMLFLEGQTLPHFQLGENVRLAVPGAARRASFYLLRDLARGSPIGKLT